MNLVKFSKDFLARIGHKRSRPLPGVPGVPGVPGATGDATTATPQTAITCTACHQQWILRPGDIDASGKVTCSNSDCRNVFSLEDGKPRTVLPSNARASTARAASAKPLLSAMVANISASDILELKAVLAESPEMNFAGFISFAESNGAKSAASPRPVRAASADSSEHAARPGENFVDYCSRRGVKASLQIIGDWVGGSVGAAWERANGQPEPYVNPMIAAFKAADKSPVVRRAPVELKPKPPVKPPSFVAFHPNGIRL